MLAQREREDGRLLTNFHTELAHAEIHENKRSLHRLPPAVIAKLQEEKIEPKHRDWLEKLLKADLYGHVGGILDLDKQIAVGQAVWKIAVEVRRVLKPRLRGPLTQPLVALATGPHEREHPVLAALVRAKKSNAMRKNA